MLDYYLVDGTLLVEEFVVGDDGAAVGLRSSDVDLSRAIRGPAAPHQTVRAVARPLASPELLPGYLPLPHAKPLTLGSEPLWRIIFSGSPVSLPADWQRVDDPRVVAVGAREGNSWELRRIGPGIAWCLDVRGIYDRSLLDSMKDALRFEGLIPVAIERLG